MFRKVMLTAAAGLPLLLAAGTAMAKTDKSFISDAVKGDNSEVSLGKLAVSKGASKGVRDFGQSLEADHAKARRQAVAVATRMGVTPPTGMKDEAKSERQKLEKLSGSAFDREFARYMVEDHKKDIEEFTDEARHGGQRVSKLAKMQLPTLKKHLKMAEKLSK